MAGLVLHLYNGEDGEATEFVQPHVPWAVLKSAVRLGKEIDAEALGEEDVDKLALFVVEVFGNRFTLDDVNRYADISEMAAVLQQVMSKATGFADGNPTRGG
mgnify:CR=1 FL=1